MKGNSLLTLQQLIIRSCRKNRTDHLLPLVNDFREAKAQLQSASGSLEHKFTATSSGLISLAQSGNEFVTQVEILVNLATGKECDDTVFSNAIRLVEDASAYLVRFENETKEMLGQLRTFKDKIEHLKTAEAEIQRTMLPLKFVQTLFKSESAPLGTALQNMFTGLTQEMEGLHNQVRDIFGTKFKQLEETRQTICQVISKLEKQAALLDKITTSHHAQVNASLQTLKTEMASNEERDARLQRLSREFAKEIDQVVVGLQFGDIINQKVQHVMSALDEIEAKAEVLSKTRDPQQTSEALQFLAQSCRVEAAQIETAMEELVKAENTIGGGVNKVLENLTQLDSHCLSLEEFKILTTSFDGMVQVLVEMIEEIRGLVAETVTNATEAYEILRPLGNLTSDLTSTVRGMACRIHLIGLNSQVQATLAAQDSKASGLEVLSARTREISDETNRLGERATLQLDALAAGLAETVKAFSELRDKGLGYQTALGEQDRREEQQLHAFRDNALRTLMDISNCFDTIRQKSKETLKDAEFSHFYKVVLPRLRETLVAIADAAELSLKSRHLKHTKTSVIDHFEKDYTMASERAVFASISKAEKTSSQAATTKPPVQVFVEPPPAKPAPVPASADFGDNVELF